MDPMGDEMRLIFAKTQLEVAFRTFLRDFDLYVTGAEDSRLVFFGGRHSNPIFVNLICIILINIVRYQLHNLTELYSVDKCCNDDNTSFHCGNIGKKIVVNDHLFDKYPYAICMYMIVYA